MPKFYDELTQEIETLHTPENLFGDQEELLDMQHDHFHASADSFSTPDDTFGIPFVQLRTQFTIRVKPNQLCEFLTALGAANINILGHLLINNHCNHPLFKFVVGTEAFESRQQVEMTKRLLRRFCIEYVENRVLKISAQTSVPGTLAREYCALNRFVTIYASYLTERNSIIFETSDWRQAHQCFKNFQK